MSAENVLGAILAGGQSRRMGGGDKAFQMLGGRPLLDHIVARARPQVAELVLNANGDPARFEQYALPVLSDVVEGYVGPLAGILTVLEWAATNRPHYEWVASFPADAPFVPLDYVATMLRAVEGGAKLACAVSGGRTHPVCGLWPVRLAGELRAALVDQNVRKIDAWTAGYRLAEVPFEIGDVDPFFNVNRPDDLLTASTYLDAVALDG